MNSVTIKNQKVKKGKKVSTLEVLDIDYSVVEDMKKAKANISFLSFPKLVHNNTWL